MEPTAKYLLVTGKIANKALTKLMQPLDIGQAYEIITLPCTVAALMTTDFVARRLGEKTAFTGEETIIIPGLCRGSLKPVQEATGCKVLRGPSDLKDLPAFLRGETYPSNSAPESGRQQIGSPIKILAEIVDAPRLSIKELLARAAYYHDSGADFIDIGGNVDEPMPKLRETIQTLKTEGFKVSIDSHLTEDILAAGAAGVDLVLSLTSRNLELAKALDCPVVLIPDDGENLDSLYRNLEILAKWNKPYILDPILPPLTMGFTQSLCRYEKIRRDFPDCELLMGLGNVTELVDADSTGVNAVVLGIAAELKVNYILTTEVSHRARGAVREADKARNLMYRAMTEGRLPKHLNYGLLTIKDPLANSFTAQDLLDMQMEVKDKNYRIFVDGRSIYMFNATAFIQGTTAQELFCQVNIKNPNHAFYLGRELDKAETALRLGKKYVQDDSLRWGYMSEEGHV